MTPRRCRPWAATELATLRELWEGGMSARAIAERLPGRSRAAIIGQANRLHLEAKPGDDALPAVESAAPPTARRGPRPPGSGCRHASPPPPRVVQMTKGPGTCVSDGCRGPRQRGRDHCAACITRAIAARKRAALAGPVRPCPGGEGG